MEMFILYKSLKGSGLMEGKPTKKKETRQQLKTDDIKRTFSCAMNGDILYISNRKSRQVVMQVRVSPYCDVLTNHMLALELMNTMLRYYRQVDADISLYRS